MLHTPQVTGLPDIIAGLRCYILVSSAIASEGWFTVALPYDSAAKFGEYAHPQVIVSTQWLAEHLDDPGLVVAESDEDVLLYETGHIPGAVKLDWHTELNDPVTRE